MGNVISNGETLEQLGLYHMSYGIQYSDENGTPVDRPAGTLSIGWDYKQTPIFSVKSYTELESVKIAQESLNKSDEAVELSQESLDKTNQAVNLALAGDIIAFVVGVFAIFGLTIQWRNQLKR